MFENDFLKDSPVLASIIFFIICSVIGFIFFTVGYQFGYNQGRADGILHTVTHYQCVVKD